MTSFAQSAVAVSPSHRDSSALERIDARGLRMPWGHGRRHLAERGHRLGLHQAALLGADEPVPPVDDPEEGGEEEEPPQNGEGPDPALPGRDGGEERAGDSVQLDHGDDFARGRIPQGHVGLDEVHRRVVQELVLLLGILLAPGDAGLQRDLAGGEGLFQVVVAVEALAYQPRLGGPEQDAVPAVDVGSEHVREVADVVEEVAEIGAILDERVRVQEEVLRLLRLAHALDDLHGHLGVPVEDLAGQETREEERGQDAHQGNGGEAQDREPALQIERPDAGAGLDISGAGPGRSRRQSGSSRQPLSHLAADSGGSSSRMLHWKPLSVGVVARRRDRRGLGGIYGAERRAGKWGKPDIVGEKTQWSPSGGAEGAEDRRRARHRLAPFHFPVSSIGYTRSGGPQDARRRLGAGSVVRDPWGFGGWTRSCREGDAWIAPPE